MAAVATALQYYAHLRLNHDAGWQNVKVHDASIVFAPYSLSAWKEVPLNLVETLFCTGTAQFCLTFWQAQVFSGPTLLG